MSDGWIGERVRTLFNCLVSSSIEIKNAEYLFRLIEEVILAMALSVQVIIHNATAYVSTKKLIDERDPTRFWSPCAAHCFDLLFEDIKKIDRVMDNLGSK